MSTVKYLAEHFRSLLLKAPRTKIILFMFFLAGIVLHEARAARLTVNISGAGYGKLIGDMSCTTYSCSADFPLLTYVLLTPVSIGDSIFGGWSGDCNGIGNCTIFMDSDHNTTANFNLIPRTVKMDSTIYDSLFDAYKASSTGKVLQLLGLEYNEGLQFNRNVKIFLRGGFDAVYNTNKGSYTRLNQPVIISSGTLIAENLKISKASATVSVPNLVGKTKDDAQKTLQYYNLKLGVVNYIQSTSIPVGAIVSQSPSAGSSVAAGSSVNLVISSGPAMVSVPNVTGQTQFAAQSAITAAGLKVGTISQQSSDEVPSGSVISQSPSAGSSVAAGSSVNLVISSGPPMVSVPDVTGKTQSTAQSAITAAGLKVGTITQQSSDEVPSGSVISQSPSAGSLVVAGSSVNLVIAFNAGVKIIGTEETVFDWTTDNCEPEDIPDLPARAFRDNEGKVQLIATHNENRRMIGDDLDLVARDCNVIMDSDRDPDPAMYNDNEWINATYSPDGATVYALIHNEYQGQAHPGMCPSGSYANCWYNSITMAVSYDSGKTYTHVAAPDHLVASVPYQYVPDAGPYGIFEGSNIFHNQKDGYFYKMLHLENYGLQKIGACVMRTQDLSDPTSWRAWDGNDFNVRFINPYKEIGYDPAEHVCEPVSFEHIEKMADSVTFNTFFNKFILVGATSKWDPVKQVVVNGFYYSLSDDLINWSERKLIMECELWWTNTNIVDRYGYPALIDPTDTSRNYSNTGQRPYLYYTRWNKNTSLDRDLIRIQIEFSK